MHISFMIVCLYIVLLFVISYYAKRRSSGSATNYVLAGRQLTTPLITVSIVGLAVGAGAMAWRGMDDGKAESDRDSGQGGGAP